MQATRPVMEALPVINVPTGLYFEDGNLTKDLTAEDQTLPTCTTIFSTTGGNTLWAEEKRASPQRRAQARRRGRFCFVWKRIKGSRPAFPLGEGGWPKARRMRGAAGLSKASDTQLARTRLRRPTFQRGKVGKARHGATGAEGPSRAKRARFPLVPPFGVRPAAAVSNDPPYLRVVTMPVRCPACRYCKARAELPAQTWKPLQFKGRSQCRTKSLRRVSVYARGKPSPWGEGAQCAHWGG